MTNTHHIHAPDFTVKEKNGILGLYVTAEDLSTQAGVHYQSPFLFYTSSKPRAPRRDIEYISAANLADLLRGVRLQSGSKEIPHIKYQQPKASRFEVAYLPGHVPYACEHHQDLDLDARIVVHGTRELQKLKRVLPQIDEERKRKAYGSLRRTVLHLLGK